MIKIRPAEPRDVEAIHALRNDKTVRAWAGMVSEIPAESNARWVAEMIADSLKTLIVAEDGERVVGYGSFSITTLAIGAGIGVAEDQRQYGIGERILIALEEEARNRGALAYGGIVHPANQPSFRLFLKRGFTLASRIPNLIKPLGPALTLTRPNGDPHK